MCGRAPTEKEHAVQGEESSTPVLWNTAELTNRRAENVSSVHSNNQNFSIIKGEINADGNSVISQPLFCQLQLQWACEKVALS